VTGQFDIPAKNAPTKDIIRARIKKTGNITASVICSVVAARTTTLSRILTAVTGRKPYIIGKDVTVPIKNLYLQPKQLGQDRLVNAYAASSFTENP
jgi:pantothenate kinase type III